MSDPRHAAAQKRLWNLAATMGSFTYHDLTHKSGLSQRSVEGHVRRWEDEGLLVWDGQKDGARKVYKVTDLGLERFKERIALAVMEGGESVEGNLWRSMRGLNMFSPVDLSTTATTEDTSVTEEEAHKYTQALLKAGYLCVRQKAVPGKRPAIYQLVKNTGPRPPEVKRLRVVVDHNENRVHHGLEGWT